jgi:3-phenylpropionate/cinnamic acid dioxygenase small subunit
MTFSPEGLEGKLDALLAAVAELEADRDIVQRLHSYCHAIDHGSEEEFLECFTDTATWTMRFRGSDDEQRFAGRAAFIDFIRKAVRAPQVYRKHLLVEPVVTRDGDTADASSYWLLIDAQPDGQPFVNSYGRYQDRLVRDGDGAWRLADRTIDVEHWGAVS